MPAQAPEYLVEIREHAVYRVRAENAAAACRAAERLFERAKPAALVSARGRAVQATFVLKKKGDASEDL